MVIVGKFCYAYDYLSLCCWLLLAKEQDADRMVGWDKGKVSGRVWSSSRGKYSSLPREEFFSPEENNILIPHRKMVRGDGKNLSLRCKGIFIRKGSKPVVREQAA